jgi:hypothetical protein
MSDTTEAPARKPPSRPEALAKLLRQVTSARVRAWLQALLTGERAESSRPPRPDGGMCEQIPKPFEG